VFICIENFGELCRSIALIKYACKKLPKVVQCKRNSIGEIYLQLPAYVVVIGKQVNIQQNKL